MADTPKRLFGPALITAASTPTTLYTVPADTITVIRYVRVSNINVSLAYQCALSIGADAPGARLFGYPSIPADSVQEWALGVPMTAGEILQGIANVANQVSVLIAGVEVT